MATYEAKFMLAAGRPLFRHAEPAAAVSMIPSGAEFEYLGAKKCSLSAEGLCRC